MVSVKDKKGSGGSIFQAQYYHIPTSKLQREVPKMLHQHNHLPTVDLTIKRLPMQVGPHISNNYDNSRLFLTSSDQVHIKTVQYKVLTK